MAIGEWDVDGMLRSMTAQQFREWELFDSVEPIGDDRADYRAASIVQAIVNSKVEKRHRVTLKDCKLQFELEAPQRTQTPEEQRRILMAIAKAYAPGVK